jgi:hypothetical protein
MPVGLFCSL